MTRDRIRLVAAVAVLAIVAVAMVALWPRGEDDPYADYCAEVEAQRQGLGEVMAAGGDSTGLIDALPAFRELAERAPDDIAADWDTAIERIEALSAAFDDAGVDPATYDREHPPEGLSKDERQEIESAASALAAPASRRAFGNVAQHARDVCHTPLSL